MTDTAFGNLVLGLAGLALVRRWYEPGAVEERTRLLDLAHRFESDDLLNFGFATPEMSVEEGYTAWAPGYDGVNAMIAAEEAVMKPRLAELFASGAAALDAGCGTGRHAATLSALGYQVVGVDATEAMLEIARSKVASADFRQGVFEALPVDDDSVDLVTSALAVCHAQELSPVFEEFARVLRPGGRLLISDPHPSAATTGGQAFFPGDGFDLPFVRNRQHPVSAYVTALIGAGFRIDACVELPYDDAVLAVNPTSEFFPEVTTQALHGLPFVLIWEATLDR